MKKVTTNITFGQILFILLTVVFASLMCFYLGAKFGPKLLNIGSDYSFNDPILPDEKLALEIKQILKDKKHDFVFADVLQSKKAMSSLQPEPEPKNAISTKDLISKDLIDGIKDIEIEDKSKEDESKVESQKSKAVQKSEKNDKEKVVVKKIDNIKVKVADNWHTEKVEEKPKKEPEVKTNNAPKPAYELQLGSYSEPKKAERAKTKWQKRGYQVRVVKFKNKDKGVWYRLRFGGYTNLNDAVKSQKTIMTKYRQSCRIIKLAQN